MAEDKKIVIVLKSEQPSENTNTNPDEPKEPNPDEKFDAPGIAVATFAAKNLAELIASEGLNWLNYEWDKTLNLHDDYVGQRNKSIAMQMISKATGITSTIIGSALAGQVAIPIPGVGAAVGAVLGAATSVASTVRENVQAKEQEEIQLRQMEAQLSYTRQRAGWSTNAASIGEDL